MCVFRYGDVHVCVQLWRYAYVCAGVEICMCVCRCGDVHVCTDVECVCVYLCV